jgi:hypothetical protein
MRMIGGSAGAGVVGSVDGPGDGLPGESLPHVDAAMASAPVTNEE